MHVMLCLDDRDGMLFNHRRQSQDRVLRAHMLALCGARGLWLNAYSAAQFSPSAAAPLHVDAQFLARASDGDYCFVEEQDLTPYWDKVQTLILFCWNRRYPADRFFDRSLLACGWTLCETQAFAGSSHPKITKEVYKR